jgi:hypothetical protein
MKCTCGASIGHPLVPKCICKPDELYTLVKSFFEDYLDVQEESDSGRVFNPIHISCVRAMKVEPMAKLLMRMRELSGAKE